MSICAFCKSEETQLHVNGIPRCVKCDEKRKPGNVFPGHGKQRWADGRIAELERKIGQQLPALGD